MDCFRPKKQRKETSIIERDQEVLRNKSESLTGLLTAFINKCKLVAVMIKGLAPKTSVSKLFTVANYIINSGDKTELSCV